MRIVSLLPAATEILYAVGAGDAVVGVTFECDYPLEAREQRIVSTSALPDGLDPAGIDAAVSAAVAARTDLYHLDRNALVDLDADLVVTQDLCAVCAIDLGEVAAALDYLGCTAQVLTTDPHTLAEVLASVGTIGVATGRSAAANALVGTLKARLDVVAARVDGRARPRVAVLEWTDPPYAPGHWVPEQVESAGGANVLGRAAARSLRIEWADLAAAEPEIVICAPCGYDLTDATELSRRVLDRIPSGAEVWAVDANAEFARPGPRLVDGVETLAAILHPSAAVAPAHATRLRPA